MQLPDFYDAAPGHRGERFDLYLIELGAVAAPAGFLAVVELRRRGRRGLLVLRPAHRPTPTVLSGWMPCSICFCRCTSRAFGPACRATEPEYGPAMTVATAGVCGRWPMRRSNICLFRARRSASSGFVFFLCRVVQNTKAPVVGHVLT